MALNSAGMLGVSAERFRIVEMSLEHVVADHRSEAHRQHEQRPARSAALAATSAAAATSSAEAERGGRWRWRSDDQGQEGAVVRW